MIPVSLRLQNFMSYGTEAPVLDFEQFQVACLSGRNGQGKSALLDAITWSLWGEARKSSGSHKPDDELIRIGEREMQVEFVFDIEGERYRVIRSYRRSATGKTTKPDLELHLREGLDGEYRPLTAPTIRDTQVLIDGVIGLDYDTFINSAFLLQGRSDEFTKKRPSERKEILARILNLSRYEALYELALEREREARRSLGTWERDIERLVEALGSEPEWKAEHERIAGVIATERTKLDALRKEERCLTERLLHLEARGREAEGLRRSLEALQRREDECRRQAELLGQRIKEAEALIERRDEIQRDYERYQKLQEERDDLDRRNELFRGVEKQLERKQRDLYERRNELERQLDRLKVELTGKRQRLGECDALLAERPSVERQLETVREAKRRFQELDTRMQSRREIEQQIRLLEQSLSRQRDELNGQWAALRQQVERDRKALPDRETLQQREAALRKQVVEREQSEQRLAEIEMQGRAIGEDLHERAGQLAARREELERLEEQQARLSDEQDGLCPTCGTELTPQHRRDVRAQFAQRIAQLRSAVQSFEQQIEKRKIDRDALRHSYKEVKTQLDQTSDAAERLGRLQEQMQRTDEAERAIREREDEMAALRRRVEKEDYGEAERRERQVLKQRLDDLEINDEAYERLREQAAQAGRYEDRLRQMEQTAGLKEQLERSIAQDERQAASIRSSMDSGEAFSAFQEDIKRLEGQLKTIGFDPQRFREVKAALEELHEAGRRLTDLVNAQQNHLEWKDQIARTEKQIDEIGVEHAKQAKLLAELEEELEGRAALEALRREKVEAVRNAESTLNALQLQLGQVSEKLDQARRDRALLKAAREAVGEAESQLALYKHLKAAFGKHGIPSLIIEQTLPDIEDRANDLLERLSDGKMHIRLETLKDKKTGGTMETLEIKITDEQGVSRAYETFSGGEGFRVNFALRLALAQLLAERSGVRVRTLVIDEGFGTQDQQGVQSLVEAIQAVQDDFDKILVITHLPELKEAFPIRIEVEKDPVDGSRFEVIGV